MKSIRAFGMQFCFGKADGSTLHIGHIQKDGKRIAASLHKPSLKERLQIATGANIFVVFEDGEHPRNMYLKTSKQKEVLPKGHVEIEI